MHTADPLLLAHCAAIAVAHDAFDSAALVSLGEKVGFGSVADFAHFTGNDWHARRLLFFLVHYGIGLTAKQKLLDNVRHAGSVNICFAPIVLFLQGGSAEDTIRYVGMGFDDVIRLPEDGHELSMRLAMQIGREHLYVETRDYLGPDRRRLEAPGHTHPERTGNHDHTLLTVFRHPEEGVHILRRQVIHARR
jgi:hypothetical protein